jgi:peptidoglycan/xylan/chitin deacetylase (PgdA/CDA1 family)
LKFLITFDLYEQFLYSFVRLSQKNKVNLSEQICIWLICLVFPLGISAQSLDLAATHTAMDGTVSMLLFEDGGSEFRMLEAFRARSIDMAENHPHLTVSGDFTGDGIDELALFSDLEYTPNLNPHFSSSVVTVSRSKGKEFIPSGTWFSSLKTQFDFDFVSFSVAGDYNGDAFDDIAFFYNDPSSEDVSIYLLESTGSGFSRAQIWYTVSRSEFNFTALKFACPGDFNGNEKPDIAVFYNYFGTTPGIKQAIFVFESEGDSFTLLPEAYSTTKATFDFTNMKYALAGDLNRDSYTDIAVLMDDSVNHQLSVPVFQGAVSGQFTPSEYMAIPETEVDLSRVIHSALGDFAGDSLEDLVLFYDNSGTGMQEILLLENEGTGFLAPETAFSTTTETLSMTDITLVRSGVFIHQPLVSATTWQDDMKGAVSFTFDDGLRGAFEHGAAELEAAGLKGTFYIFTDTATVYDGELASTGLVRTYKELGHEIGSHTANHSDLGFLSESGELDSLEEVLSVSVELLNERFDQETASMSIPFGSFRYETLEYISRYFYSARSSQFGFNLATPYDFYALKSWPILSTSYPDYVDNLLAIAESYGSYLPLMYHDMVDESFDEEADIYNYRRELFWETVQDAISRDLWIDTYERIYKYIRERNALRISQVNLTGEGSFSFIADDELADSVFNVELTLKIILPESWMDDTLTIETGGSQFLLEANQGPDGSFVYFKHVPLNSQVITVYEGNMKATGIREQPAEVNLSISASPNPFRHETRIDVSGSNESIDHLIIRDIHGRIVMEYKEHGMESYTLSRATLPPGIYIIQVLGSGRQLGALKIMAR